MRLRGKHQFVSPLQPQFWEAWKKFSCDPEPCIAKWAREGVPLGMAAKIPSSNGVFPPVSDEPVETYVPELEEQMGLQNYTSVTENMEAAVGEIDRLVDKGFAITLSKEEACQTFQQGTQCPSWP